MAEGERGAEAQDDRDEANWLKMARKFLEDVPRVVAVTLLKMRK